MSRLCVICGDVAHGCHFGVLSCKACSAFFRRTITKRQAYKCEKDEDCVILAESLIICKGCRIKKCLNAGMRICAVQNHRDPYGKRTETGTVSRPLGPTLTFLQHIGKNYNRLEELRSEMYKSEGERAPRSLNYKEAYGMYLDERLVVVDWLINSFPAFRSMAEEQKNLLVGNCYAHFVVLEGGLLSSRHGREDVRFLASGDYIDCSDLTTYYTDPEGLQPMTSKEAIEVYGHSFRTYQRNVWHPMLREKIECFEFLVLVALALFDSGIDGLTDETVAICKENQESMKRELLLYYKSSRSENDYFLRLGTVISIIPNLQRATQRWKEIVELGNLLQSYKVDPVFYSTCFEKF